jgi:hypothetical protein
MHTYYDTNTRRQTKTESGTENETLETTPYTPHVLYSQSPSPATALIPSWKTTSRGTYDQRKLTIRYMILPHIGQYPSMLMIILSHNSLEHETNRKMSFFDIRSPFLLLHANPSSQFAHGNMV